MKDALVSIIVPVYNQEKHIQKCLLSIVNQDYFNIEIIVINDGSTDKTSDIVKQIASGDKRIKLIENKNNGVSFSRNCGITNSTGTFIAFVDSDDYIHQEYISELLSAKETNGLSIINISPFNEKKIYPPLYKTNCQYISYDIKEYIINVVMKYKTNPIVGGIYNKLFERRILIDENIFFDLNRNFAEDFLFNIHYLKHVQKITIINKTMYYYRLAQSGTLSRSAKPLNYWLENYESLNFSFLDFLIEMFTNEKLIEQYSKDFLKFVTKMSLNRYLYYGSNISFKEYRSFYISPLYKAYEKSIKEMNFKKKIKLLFTRSWLYFEIIKIKIYIKRKVIR
jgi:glycosyltransferase involved in cell wall biosynthesis